MCAVHVKEKSSRLNAYRQAQINRNDLKRQQRDVDGGPSGRSSRGGVTTGPWRDGERVRRLLQQVALRRCDDVERARDDGDASAAERLDDAQHDVHGARGIAGAVVLSELDVVNDGAARGAGQTREAGDGVGGGGASRHSGVGTCGC